MDWINGAFAALVFILTAFAGISSWVFRRELSRNDRAHDELHEVINSKYALLDRDIKDSGSRFQQVIRDEIGQLASRMDAQNHRLDQIILHYSSDRERRRPNDANA